MCRFGEKQSSCSFVTKRTKSSGVPIPRSPNGPAGACAFRAWFSFRLRVLFLNLPRLYGTEINNELIIIAFLNSVRLQRKLMRTEFCRSASLFQKPKFVRVTIRNLTLRSAVAFFLAFCRLPRNCEHLLPLLARNFRRPGN